MSSTQRASRSPGEATNERETGGKYSFWTGAGRDGF